jgi:hypothetical protein
MIATTVYTATLHLAIAHLQIQKILGSMSRLQLSQEMQEN